MRVDENDKYLTPHQTPKALEIDRSPPRNINSPRNKFRSISPDTLQNVKKVLDFTSLETQFKRRNKISKRNIVKERTKERIPLVKLR